MSHTWIYRESEAWSGTCHVTVTALFYDIVWPAVVCSHNNIILVVSSNVAVCFERGREVHHSRYGTDIFLNFEIDAERVFSYDEFPTFAIETISNRSRMSRTNFNANVVIFQTISLLAPVRARLTAVRVGIRKSGPGPHATFPLLSQGYSA